MRADAAQDPEHALDEKRRLDDTALEEVLRRIQVTDVVALDLEARSVVGARRQDVLDVLERVAEDSLVRARQIFALPAVLEFLEALEHRKETEVHRTHVERSDLGLELQRRLQTFLDRHRRGAAGREVDDDVGAALDVRGEFAEIFWVLRRMAVD